MDVIKPPTGPSIENRIVEALMKAGFMEVEVAEDGTIWAWDKDELSAVHVGITLEPNE